MGVDAVDGTIGATAVSYMTGEGAADVPCIAQLLLSCLSEDSAEKVAHSSALSGPKSMTDEVVSVNVVSCEMKIMAQALPRLNPQSQSRSNKLLHDLSHLRGIQSLRKISSR
jgi:hypothetical protein